MCLFMLLLFRTHFRCVAVIVRDVCRTDPVESLFFRNQLVSPVPPFCQECRRGTRKLSSANYMQDGTYDLEVCVCVCECVLCVRITSMGDISCSEDDVAGERTRRSIDRY